MARIRIIEIEGDDQSAMALFRAVWNGEASAVNAAPETAPAIAAVAPAPRRIAPARTTPAKAAPGKTPASDKPVTVSDLIRECLSEGPRSPEALVGYCRSHGKPNVDLTQVKNLVYQLSRKDEVEQNERGEWRLTGRAAK